VTAIAELDDLIDHLVLTSRLTRGEAERLVGDVMSFLSEEPEAYVRRRHRDLQKLGLKNEQVFAQVETELTRRRFAAPLYSRRQLRRIIYG
jgi:polyhydroxyalkanoate synthesis regulator phasin